MATPLSKRTPPLPVIEPLPYLWQTVDSQESSLDTLYVKNCFCINFPILPWNLFCLQEVPRPFGRGQGSMDLSRGRKSCVPDVSRSLPLLHGSYSAAYPGVPQVVTEEIPGPGERHSKGYHCLHSNPADPPWLCQQVSEWHSVCERVIRT